MPRRRLPRSLARTSGITALGALLAACGEIPPSTAVDAADAGERMPVCHVQGARPAVLEIAAAALPAHEEHGDYLVELVVDQQGGASGGRPHFRRIGDAIEAARAGRLERGETVGAACRITIAIAPGLYRGATQQSADPTIERLPLVIDVPDLTLRGAFAMPLDAWGRAAGGADLAGATTLLATPGLVSINTGLATSKFAEPMIVVNAHPGGSAGHGAVIEGFVFQSGNDAPGVAPGGHGVFAMRAQGLVVRGNRFEGGFTEPIDLRASVARVEQNYITGRGGSCAICLAGPGDFEVAGNRLTGPGGTPGIFLLPVALLPVYPVVEQYVLQPTAAITAAIVNNEVRNHQAVPVGVGLRIAALGAGAQDVVASTHVVARGNALVNNRFAVIVEAGFPVAGAPLRGDVDLTLEDNDLTGSCQTSLLVSLSRHTTGLGIDSRPYLRSSTFSVSLGGNLAWQDAWYAHPAGLGNTLTVDGQAVPNGIVAPYDGSRTCAP